MAVESIFIGVLYCDILQADTDAQKEYKRLSLCQDIQAHISNFNTVLQAVGMAKAVKSPHNDTVSLTAQQNYLSSVENLSQQILNMNIEAALVKDFQKRSKQLIPQRIAVEEGKTPDDKSAAYVPFARNVGVVFRDAYKVIRQLHKAMANMEHPPALFGLPPQDLIGIAAIVNILYLLLFAIFIEREISRPISRLAADCEKLKQGIAIETDSLNRSEIGVLQESFRQMSQQIVQNNNRRKGYIAIMQTVQLAILQFVRDRLAKLTLSATLSDKAKARLQKACANIGTLIQLLHSMTDLLGDNESLNTTIQAVQLNTAKLAHDAAASVDSLIQARGIRLELSQANYDLVADPNLIGRVLLNLLSNAIKYSPDGGTVKLSIFPEGGMLRFDIEDEGPGISAAAQSKLFQRFSQVGAADGIQRAGTGLGLVICKEFVEAHGGKIGCNSEAGRGSCFWFLLPTEATPGSLINDKETKAESTRPMKGAPHNSVSKGKSGKKSRSIKTGFVLTLVSFLAIQAVLFLQLHNRFKDSEIRATTLSLQKNQLLEMQELMIQYAYYSRILQIASLERNITVAKDVLVTLRKFSANLARVTAKQEKESKTKELLLEASDANTKLISLLDYGFSNLEETLSQPNVFISKAETVADKTTYALMEANQLESAKFKNSFDWSKQLRADLMTLLLIAGTADLLVIAFGALNGFKTTKRILVLKAKAEDFSQGAALIPSLTGNDELSLLDQRLCKAADAISSAEYQRQELTAIINHDLRTPLSSILGTLELIAQGGLGPLGESDVASIEQSRSELHTLLLQINDLLLLEKIESGSYQMQWSTIDIDELLNESVSRASAAAAEKDVALRVEIKSTPGTKTLKGDKDLLLYLLGAIIKNAIAASPTGASVEVSASASGDRQITISCRDCGTGIKAELLAHIFDRFRFFDGKAINGLGLPLAHRICRLHNGSIQFLSTEPGSTIVEIKLAVA